MRPSRAERVAAAAARHLRRICCCKGHDHSGGADGCDAGVLAPCPCKWDGKPKTDRQARQERRREAAGQKQDARILAARAPTIQERHAARLAAGIDPGKAIAEASRLIVKALVETKDVAEEDIIAAIPLRAPEPHRRQIILDALLALMASGAAVRTREGRWFYLPAEKRATRPTRTNPHG